MAYTKERKQSDVEHLKRKLEESGAFILADPVGLTVAQSNDLRMKLRREGGSMRVYKNTLIRRVLQEEGGFEKLLPELEGPTALVFSKDPISLSKALLDFAKDNELLQIKSGYYDGAALNRAEVLKLSKLGSREEVIGRLVLSLKGPMYRLVMAMKSPATKLNLVLKAVAEKEEKK